MSDQDDYSIIQGSQYKLGNHDNLVEFKETDVPSELLELIPLAKQWGVSDDILRERLLESAPKDDLNKLIRLVDIYDAQLDSWLSGSESYSTNLSDAYVAFSYLRMAADSARYL